MKAVRSPAVLMTLLLFGCELLVEYVRERPLGQPDVSTAGQKLEA